MHNIKESDVTFVIQGSLSIDTRKNVLQLKENFPSSTFILSTWESDLIPSFGAIVDLIIVNDDPGENCIGFHTKKKQYRYANTNRQIVSTYQGLCKVKTKYAIKIRSDCTLTTNFILKSFNKYNRVNHDYQIFKKKILISNNYAFYELSSIPMPYNISDFFMFGLTEDLLKLWDIELFSGFQPPQNIKTSKRYLHKNTPFIQLHIEQAIWLKCLNKYKEINPIQKLSIDKKIISESNHYLVNNMVIYSANTLGLAVPERHQIHTKAKVGDSLFTHNDWVHLYDQLILKEKKEINLSKIIQRKLNKLRFKSIKTRVRIALIILFNDTKKSKPTEL